MTQQQSPDEPASGDRNAASGADSPEVQPDDQQIDRRQFVVAAGGAGIAALAGCVGDDDGDDEPVDTDDAGVDDTADDGDDEPVDTDDTDDTPDADDTAETDDEEEGLSAADLSFEESFVYEGRIHDEMSGEQIEVTFSQHGGDHHMRVTGAEHMDEFETYLVDGTTYQVFDGMCMKGDFGGDQDTPDIDAEIDEDDELFAGIPPEPDRTDTIDGDRVDVYEILAEDVPHEDHDVTLYIDSETGYLRRMDSEMFSFDLHSWGEVDPIEPPEMDCQEMGGMPDDGY